MLRRSDRLLVWVNARAQGRIANPQQCQVAIQRASRIDIAVAHHEGGPGERVHRQQRIGRGRGGELGSWSPA